MCDHNKKIVEPLYKLCIQTAVKNFTKHKKLLSKDIQELPDHILFDFYYLMFQKKRLCQLLDEWSKIEVFVRMLTVKHRRTDLLIVFQKLINHYATILDDIVEGYLTICKSVGSATSTTTRETLQIGLRLGVFLSEGAWYREAHEVFNATEKLASEWSTDDEYERKVLLLDCYQTRLYVEANYALFNEAEVTVRQSLAIVEEIEATKNRSSSILATVFANFAFLYIMRCEFNEAFEWASKSLTLLNDSLPKKMCIFVLRIAAKACVLKRKYRQANFLIQQALHLAEDIYERDLHPDFADTLMVHAFFLLNFDNYADSVAAYKRALTIRKNAFGKDNILVAISYEELAYALYVYEYNSGVYDKALKCIDVAAEILDRHLPADHLFLAYTKRIKGLILEEIALDMTAPTEVFEQQKYFKDAEALHKSALDLSLKTFGQRNLQTARHFGNLGRLYQSMDRLEQAEEMQLLAIEIKREILGLYDFEVGLSAGHLASLYNFHMKRFEEAEIYHQIAISIAIRLFGDAYSGLEYEYRGLIRVYVELNEVDKLHTYKEIMERWQKKRESPPQLEQWSKMGPVSQIVDKFFTWTEETN